MRFQLSPIGNPINLVGNMLGAIPVGIDDTVQQAGGPRVLGTPDVYRPFGVGGPVYDKTTGDEIETTDSNILDPEQHPQLARSARFGAARPDRTRAAAGR